MSRASTKSIRSGKSREIQSLRNKSGLKEGSPSEVLSDTKAKMTIERDASNQATASRSMIGAVINRISSIFSRKHSSKIHPGSKAEQDSTESSQCSNVEDQTSKADDKIHITNVPEQGIKHTSIVNIPVMENTCTTGNSSLTTPNKDAQENQKIPNAFKEERTNITTGENKAPTEPEPELEPEPQTQPETEPKQKSEPGPELNEDVNIPLKIQDKLSSDKSCLQAEVVKAPADSVTADNDIDEDEKESALKEKENEEYVLPKDAEEPQQTNGKSRSKTKESHSGDDKTRRPESNGKPDLTIKNKRSFDKRQRGSKNRSKSGSDVSIVF